MSCCAEGPSGVCAGASVPAAGVPVTHAARARSCPSVRGAERGVCGVEEKSPAGVSEVSEGFVSVWSELNLSDLLEDGLIRNEG